MDGFELGQDKISPVRSSRVQRESEGVCKKDSTYPGIIRPIIERFRVAGDAMRSIRGFEMVIRDGHVDDFGRDFGIVLLYPLNLSIHQSHFPHLLPKNQISDGREKDNALKKIFIYPSFPFLSRLYGP